MQKVEMKEDRFLHRPQPEETALEFQLQLLLGGFSKKKRNQQYIFLHNRILKHNSYYTNFVQLLDLLCIVSSWTYKLLFIGSSWSGFCKKSPFRYYKSFDRVSDTINHLIGSPRDCGFLKIPSDTINHMIGSPRDCGFLKIPSDTINHLIWSPRVLRD